MCLRFLEHGPQNPQIKLLSGGRHFSNKIHVKQIFQMSLGSAQVLSESLPDQFSFRKFLELHPKIPNFNPSRVGDNIFSTEYS